MGPSAEFAMGGSELSDQMDLLRQAHLACESYRFGAAFDAFSRADRLGDLSTEDVLAWSEAAWWLGRTDRSLELAELGHRQLVDEGESTRAAKEAIGLGFLLMMRGDLAAGSGCSAAGHCLNTLPARCPAGMSRSSMRRTHSMTAMSNGPLILLGRHGTRPRLRLIRHCCRLP